MIVLMSANEWASAAIRWIEHSPYLHEARMTTADGVDLYAGYVAVVLGTAMWRGYIGRGFVPLGIGPLTEMQAAIEQRVAESMQRNGEDLHHAS